jgi:hypothetical protein
VIRRRRIRLGSILPSSLLVLGARLPPLPSLSIFSEE